VLQQVPAERNPELLTLFADGAHAGGLEEIALDEHALKLQIVPKLQGQEQCVVLPRRWVVERTLTWLVRYRRLRADYETEPTSSRGWIYVAAIHRMARCLGR
jgi:putative transposase